MDTWASPWADDPGPLYSEKNNAEHTLKNNNGSEAEALEDRVVHDNNTLETEFRGTPAHAWSENDANPFAADEGFVWATNSETNLEEFSIPSFSNWRTPSPANTVKALHDNDSSEQQWPSASNMVDEPPSNLIAVPEIEAWSQNVVPEVFKEPVAPGTEILEISGGVNEQEHNSDDGRKASVGTDNLVDPPTSLPIDSIQDDDAKLDKDSSESPAASSTTMTSLVDNASDGSNLSERTIELGTEPTIIQTSVGEDDDFGDFEEETIADPIEDAAMQEESSIKSLELRDTDQLSPLDFEIDTGLVKKLYPMLPEFESLAPVHEIISTISERKAWGHISRKGTLAQHNSGEGDDYIRVTWSKSKIRDEVDKIVAKWIKEGKFISGSSLSGDRTHGAMFGWGEGAITRPAGSRNYRNSVPAVFGHSSTPNATKFAHKPSVSISSWDPLASPKPTEASPVLGFGWSDATSITSSVAASPTVATDTVTGHGTPAHTDSSPVRSLKHIKEQTIKTPPVYVDSSKPSTTNPKLRQNTHVSVIPADSHANPDLDGLKDFDQSTPKPSSTSITSDLSSISKSTVTNPEDQWNSAYILDSSTIGSKHPQEVTPKKVQESALSFHSLKNPEITNLPLSNSIKEENKLAAGEDEWGDFIETPLSPGTPISPHIQPIHEAPSPVMGNSLPPGTSTNINETTPTRKPSIISAVSHIKSSLLSSKLLHRNSTPSLDSFSSPSLSTVISSKLHLSSIQKETSKTASSSQETTPTKAVEWDFSVFEQEPIAKALDQPRSKSVAAPEGHLREITPGMSSTQEDNIVKEIVDGLPDLSYMLR